MKVLIASIAMLILSLIPRAGAQTIAAYGSFIVTNSHTSFTNLIVTNLNCTTFTLVGFKAGGLTNAEVVWMGTSSNLVVYPVYPALEFTVTAPRAGEKVNLKNYWIRNASANDGVLVIYQ